MAIETWIAFVIVSLALLAMPGPIILYICVSVLHHGRSTAVAIVPGSMTGDLFAMSASLLGVGVLIAQYPALMIGMKVAGSLILLAIGIRMIASARTATVPSTTNASRNGWNLFGGGFALAALHPSSFVFFTAFAPQFIDSTRPFSTQALILTTTFVLLGGLTSFVWLLCAEKARAKVLNQSSSSRVQFLSGALTIGLALAFMGLSIA